MIKTSVSQLDITASSTAVGPEPDPGVPCSAYFSVFHAPDTPGLANLLITKPCLC